MKTAWTKASKWRQKKFKNQPKGKIVSGKGAILKESIPKATHYYSAAPVPVAALFNPNKQAVPKIII